jgi:hypothetical protein
MRSLTIFAQAISIFIWNDRRMGRSLKHRSSPILDRIINRDILLPNRSDL